MNAQILRGPMLNPRPNGTVDFYPDGALVADTEGLLTFVGGWAEWDAQGHVDTPPVTRSAGLLLPPLLDCHTHIPQHPIRGRFTEGVGPDPPEGRLLAGLTRNVFPKEAEAVRTRFATQFVEEFAADTLSQGVVGGSGFMTVHAKAARIALSGLSEWWSVGLVLMNQHCPTYLRTDEDALQKDAASLAEDFGRRLIISDRFAVSVDTPLRRRGARIARNLGLRMQTHLNEQRAEKALVEGVMYPGYASYTDVYREDGLLAQEAILAHCLQMTPDEWAMVADAGATIAHCPTSNTLLGSGTMLLDEVMACHIPYAICTDVGASPTTSLLAEMAQFLKVHAGRSAHATAEEALFRVTLAPAQILGLESVLGSFDIGKPLSYIEAECDPVSLAGKTAEAVIREDLLGMTDTPELKSVLNELALHGLTHGPELAQVTQDVTETAARLERKVQRVVVQGQTVWQRA